MRIAQGVRRANGGISFNQTQGFPLTPKITNISQMAGKRLRVDVADA